MKTAFPGPKSSAYVNELSKTFDSMRVFFPIDTANSCGNYISDLDGNQYLDMFTSIAAIGHGYNHPALLEIANSEAVKR